MYTLLMMLIFFLSTDATYITFDTGESIKFNSPACSANQSNSETITFQGTFVKIPQVFIYPDYFSMNYSPSRFNQVEQLPLVITQTDFTITVSCVGGNTNRYHYVWYAFVDTQLTVISPGLQNVTNDGQIFIHSHTNVKATKGVVMMTGMGYQDNFDYKLMIQEITSSEVKIKIQTINSNIKTICYTILLGNDKSLSVSAPMNSGSGHTYTIYSSPWLDIPSNGILFCQITGFAWSLVDQPRLVSKIFLSGSTVQYQIGTFSNTAVDAIYFQYIWVYTPYYPMLVRKYSVTRIYYRHPGFTYKVTFLNQIYTSIGTYNYLIPVDTTSVTISIYMEHKTPLKKLVGTFLNCNNCGTQNQYYLQLNYISVYNFIKLSLQLVQDQDYSYKSLTISIFNNGISITQDTNLSDDDSTIVNLFFL